MVKHRTFLFWLLYIVCVISGAAILFQVGLPQIALHHDHSYLTCLLFGLFLAAEASSARQAWVISKENVIVDAVEDWLKVNPLSFVGVDDKSVILNSPVNSYQVPPSVIGTHLRSLFIKSEGGQQDIKQDVLLNITAERLYDHMPAEFIAHRIVWIGILATIIGVIMAFWPMIDGVSIDLMKSNLSTFFGGIAVAFIPTAVSFVFKILLDCNVRIISVGIRNLLDRVAHVSEVAILPFLSRKQG